MDSDVNEVVYTTGERKGVRRGREELWTGTLSRRMMTDGRGKERRSTPSIQRKGTEREECMIRSQLPP